MRLRCDYPGHRYHSAEMPCGGCGAAGRKVRTAKVFETRDATDKRICRAIESLGYAYTGYNPDLSSSESDRLVNLMNQIRLLRSDRTTRRLTEAGK